MQKLISQKLISSAALVAAIASAVMAMPVSAGPVLDRIQANGTLNIGYPANQAPFASTQNGNPTGYSVDLCQTVAESLKTKLGRPDLKVQFTATPEADGLNAVAQGSLDLYCGAVAQTLARRATVSFSIPVFASGISALTRSDAPESLQRVLLGEKAHTGPISRATVNRGIANHKYVVLKGSVSEEWVKAQVANLGVTVKIIAAETPEEALKLLTSKKADAIFGERFQLQMAAASNEGLLVAPRFFTAGPYGIALARGDDDFRLDVDTALSHKMRADDFLLFYSKHFGEPNDNVKLLSKAYSLP